MLRIGIIGSENSHATIFARFLNVEKRFDGFTVTAIAGEEDQASAALQQESGAEWYKDPLQMLGQVDALMVTSRNGGLHAGYARPFLAAGLPVYVDKPVANSAQDALAIVRAAASSGAPVMGGSTMKLSPTAAEAAAEFSALRQNGEAAGGIVTGPLKMNSVYGGFYFYASHVAEVALGTFGGRPAAVTAHESGGHVTAVLHYGAYDVSVIYLDEGKTAFTLTLLSTGGEPRMRLLDIGDVFLRGLDDFVRMVRTGKMPQTHAELIAPVCVMNAMERSYSQAGRCVEIVYPEI